MKIIELKAVTNTMDMPIDLMATDNAINVNHQITLEPTDVVNDGFTVAISVKPYGSSAFMDVSGGSFNLYTYIDTCIPIIILNTVITEIRFTVTGRLTGSFDIHYAGYGIFDKGVM